MKKKKIKKFIKAQKGGGIVGGGTIDMLVRYINKMGKKKDIKTLDQKFPETS